MRITPGITARNFLFNAENLNGKLEDVSQQVSTGKRLLHLKDSPLSSAELVGLRDQLSEIDQYRANSDQGSYFLGVADSVLSAVHDMAVSVFTKGSAAASETLNSQGRASIALEIRSLRDQMLSLANTKARGRYLFSGSQVTTVPFTISGDQVTYHGDQLVNKISISDESAIKAGLAGDNAFLPVFSAIHALLTALDSNDVPAIQAALAGFEPVRSGISRFRGELGMDINLAQEVKNELDMQESNVKSRQNVLEDANLAQAITQMNQLQTALQATLTAQSSVQRRNLFDFLG